MTARARTPRPLRRLVLVLGDQLAADSAAFDGFDPAVDAVWMAEAAEEAEHVWCSKPRAALFLSAMRHFRESLRSDGMSVNYTELDAPANTGSLSTELRRAVLRLQPNELIVVEPGEYRVREALVGAARDLAVPLAVRPDRHFLCSHDQFADHADGRRQLRLEHFYREMRRRHGILMAGSQPAGGSWNFDSQNRDGFGRDGPGQLPRPPGFAPDAITRDVLALIERRFPDHPGSLDAFDWPVTADQARACMDDFVACRLPEFGRHQDAMWTDEPFLRHSLLSPMLNLKLLDPRIVLSRAEQAFERGRAPINSVEGFVRQILGWREYVRGVYWRFMPEYLDMNALAADADLPAFYWTGDVEAVCLRQVIEQTLRYGYAHHIQRLMVTGLFALLLGVAPRRVHEWYLAVYVDAVEWVEAPNTLGMSQFADGGAMASKPYVATGKYIDRMSDYCRCCPLDPATAVGPDACPFTTLYWDFLIRHEALLNCNQRMSLQVRNLKRLDRARRREIRTHADRVRARWT